MKMTRHDILTTAEKCVCGEREESYGNPESNFGTISDLWNGYLSGRPNPKENISPKDVAAMMALLKIARIASGQYKSDNWIDLAGYAACGGEIEASSALKAKDETDTFHSDAFVDKRIRVVVP